MKHGLQEFQHSGTPKHTPDHPSLHIYLIMTSSLVLQRPCQMTTSRQCDNEIGIIKMPRLTRLSSTKQHDYGRASTANEAHSVEEHGIDE